MHALNGEVAGEYSRNFNIRVLHLSPLDVCVQEVNAGCRVFVGELNRGVCGTGSPPNNLHEGACPPPPPP